MSASKKSRIFHYYLINYYHQEAEIKRAGFFSLSDHLKRLSANGYPLEELFRGRWGWLRLLGFDLGAPTPDANTIRLFREKITDASTNI